MTLNNRLEMNQTSDSIKVMVRVRPLNERERYDGARSCVQFDQSRPNTIIMMDSKMEQKPFTFDFVGGEHTTQEDMFRIGAQPLLIAALEGYNACIFAYGQTGAGKTYTMQGRALDSKDSHYHHGLQPRVIDSLFTMTENDTSTEYLIKCSFLEIYNESIMDLLSKNPDNLPLREDLKRGVFVEGLTEEYVSNSEETISMLIRGMRNRHTSATSMNSESSRSHSVFSLTIESKRTENDIISIKTSKLNFVDLAGSERQKLSSTVGERLKEATSINKSLTTLGLVINTLAECTTSGRDRHVPYRDSKLTFLLRDSLGGNSRTCMIAAVSAATTSSSETLSTLQFAQRAKLIENKASINEEAQGSVEQLRKEIKRLNDELAVAVAGNSRSRIYFEESRFASRQTSRIYDNSSSVVSESGNSSDSSETTSNSHMNSKINDLQSDLVDCKQQICILQAQTERSETLMKEEREKRLKANEECCIVLDQRDELISEVEILKQNLIEQVEDNCELRQENAKLKEEMRIFMNNLQNMKSEMNARIEGIQRVPQVEEVQEQPNQSIDCEEKSDIQTNIGCSDAETDTEQIVKNSDENPKESDCIELKKNVTNEGISELEAFEFASERNQQQGKSLARIADFISEETAAMDEQIASLTDAIVATTRTRKILGSAFEKYQLLLESSNRREYTLQQSLQKLTRHERQMVISDDTFEQEKGTGDAECYPGELPRKQLKLW